jgi:hypothetical protein
MHSLRSMDRSSNGSCPNPKIIKMIFKELGCSPLLNLLQSTKQIWHLIMVTLNTMVIRVGSMLHPRQ